MALRSPAVGRHVRPMMDGGRLWIDAEGRVLRADAAAATLLGRDADRLRGTPLRDLVRGEGEGPHGLRALVPDAEDAWAERPDGTRVPLVLGLYQDGGTLVLHLRDATARREAEDRVRRSEEQLRNAQHIARIGSWSWDVVHDNISWSQELFDIYGLDPAAFEASYEGFMERIHEEDRDAVEQAVQGAFKDGAPFTIRHRIVRPDGAVRHIHGQGAVETDGSGKPLRMYGIAQDVTDQVQAGRMFEALLESAPDAMVLVDPAGAIRYVNEEAERMFGYGRGELMGKPVETLIPEGLHERHTKHRTGYVHAPRRRPMGGDLDLEARRRDGSVFPVEISLSPVETEEGLLVTAAIRDVSDRRRVEQEVRDRQARVESLLQNAMDAVVLTDLDGRIVEWNPAAERMFGRPAAEAMGERFQDFAMPPEAQARFRSLLDACRDGLAKEHQVWEADLTGANGKLPIEASLARVEAGKDRFLLAVLRDVTERRKAEESDRLAFERLIEIQQLREVNRFKTILLNTASHELNTPMTPLRLQLHLLESGRLGNLTDRQRHAVEVLQRNVERLSMLIQDVLDVARLESGKLKMVQEPMHVSDAVHEAVDTFDQAIAKAKLDVHVDIQGEPQVVADRNRLVQVLVNLVSNAVKFSPPGGHLEVTAAPEDGKVLVRVQDQGPGLEPEQIANLFQPFSQVHDLRQTNIPGTGLGLYICKGIVEQHGGSIGVESAGRDKGATFWFRLPLRRQASGPA